jgi:hypothetical protein
VAAAQPYPRPRLKARRRSHAGRYAAALAYLAALGLVFFLAAPAYRDRGPAVDRGAAAPLPARPAHLPAVIPSWAWKLSAWHATSGSERGRRPHGAPHPLPGWYWTWHAWRMQVERHAAA